jgi:hypothetical protein
MNYTPDTASCGMIYIPSFGETGTCVQALLRFSLINFSNSNVGITSGGIYEVRC